MAFFMMMVPYNEKNLCSKWWWAQNSLYFQFCIGYFFSSMSMARKRLISIVLSWFLIISRIICPFHPHQQYLWSMIPPTDAVSSSQMVEFDLSTTWFFVITSISSISQDIILWWTLRSSISYHHQVSVQIIKPVRVYNCFYLCKTLHLYTKSTNINQTNVTAVTDNVFHSSAKLSLFSWRVLKNIINH